MKKTLLFIFLLQSFLLRSQTVFVKDINPSSDSKEEPGGDHLVINGVAYFTAEDGTSGIELWRSDGTVSGTFLVKDINPGSESSQPVAFHEVNGELLFYANDGTSGAELWKTDGTESGTVMLKDIAPGAAGSYLEESPFHFDESAFAVLDNKLYFAADDGVGGRELWISDGTELGTNQIYEFESGTTIDSPLEFFLPYNGRLFFRANKRLWISDGTTAGTKIFTTKVTAPEELVLADNGFYFSGFDSGAGYELWFSDGTEDGTYLVKDICPCTFNDGALLSNINQNYATVGDKLFFVGNDQDQGLELWVSDGTEAGTVKLTNIPSGGGSGTFNSFTKLGDKLILAMDDDSGFGSELWISDGTVAGTMMIKDIIPGSSSSVGFPVERVVFRNKLLFQVDDFFDQYLWETDGSESGTLFVTEHLDSDEFNPGDFMVLNDSTLLFFGKHGSLGRELLKFTEPKALNVSVNVETGISCFGESDGSISAMGTGGYPPYQYNWADGTTSSMLSGLGGGQYEVTVTDTRNTAATTIFDLVAPDSISYPDPIVTNETNGMSNGSIEVTGVTGGTPPYTIEWTTGDTTFTVSNLSLGGYVFWIRDANGCEVQSRTFIVQNTSSTNDPILNQIQITPTLVTEGFINIENVLVSTPYEIQILSGTGQLMTSKKQLTGNNRIEINHPSGVYFIRLAFDDKILTKRILIPN